MNSEDSYVIFSPNRNFLNKESNAFERIMTRAYSNGASIQFMDNGEFDVNAYSAFMRVKGEFSNMETAPDE